MAESVSLTEVTRPSRTRLVGLRAALSHVGLVAGGLIFGILVLLAAFAPVLAPRSPHEISMFERLIAPGRAHWLGTDHLGRDILSRLLYGARLSMFVSVTVAVLASLTGVTVGLIGGYSLRFGNLAMRTIDGLMAFPGIILALSLIAVLGTRVSNLIIALSVVYSPRVARVVHGVVLELREREYVSAAIALGATWPRVALRHIVPNCMGPIIVQSSFNFASAIIAEASLSFLGLGVPPGTPSWGSILSDGRNYMLIAPWITVFPGLTIFIAVMGLNILGDSLRDVLDPRLRGTFNTRTGRVASSG